MNDLEYKIACLKKDTNIQKINIVLHYFIKLLLNVRFKKTLVPKILHFVTLLGLKFNQQ